MSFGCIYTQELEVWSLHYMYMPHNQKLKCHHYVMTLLAFGLGAIGVNKDRISSSCDIFPEYS